MTDTATLPSDLALAEALLPATLDAGRAILDVRARSVTVEHKADSSPVTEADRAAEAIILKALAEHAPGIPVVAEESVEAGNLPAVGDIFFLVDPLDGTKEFIKGGSDFTVNIALVRGNAPAMGIVYAPAAGRLYVGTADDGAWAANVTDGAIGGREPIAVRVPGDAVDVVASKSHRTPETDAYIGQYPVGELVSAGSSLKFCLVATGRADLYPRFGRTMEWDTAAGHAVLLAAGGQVYALDGEPLDYGKPSFENPHFYAVGVE